MSSEILDHHPDSPIAALQECFAESNLPHKLLSNHAVVLKLQGDWQEYDLVFVHQPDAERFEISASLSVQIPKTSIEALYGLIGRMNGQLSYGHYTVDAEQLWVGYRYALPEQTLPALDIDGLESLIEQAIVALETLYPVLQSLLFGDKSLDEAMGKYLYAAQGTA